MGRLLDGLKDAEYNPHTAVCKLPQPFRMLDKLLSRLVDDAVNLAVERDEARLAARGIAEGTEVLAPSAVVDDIGAMTAVSSSRDGAWAFVGNEDGELVVVNVERGSVASKTKVLAGSIAAVDAVAVDPPPPPPPRPPTPPPEETTETEGEGEGAEGTGEPENAEPKDEDAEPKDDDAELKDKDAAATEGLSFDDIAAAAGGLSPADVAPLYLVALAGTNGEITVVAVDCSTGSVRSDNATVVAAGDAPVDAGVGNAVVRVTFSPNGAALAVTCGGGAMAVYAVEKPPIEAFTILKDETDPLKGGDGETGLKDDDVAASAEGEGDDAPPAEDTEDTEGGGEANTEASSGPVDFVAARDAARRLKPLVWLTADYAARTFGPFEPKTDVAEGESAPEGAEGAAETAPAEGEGATQGEPEDPSKRAKGAPTVHFRCSGDEANAAFVSWRNTNRLAMFQLTGARNMPSKLALVPTLRGEEPEPEEEATEGDGDYGAEEDPKPPKPTPPAGDWTMPFPISATASTDGGALLALAMIDGSIVLFNARLGAVARTFRRIGNFGPGLDGFDPSAPPSAADDSHVERAASEPLACAALSFWTRVDDTEGSGGVEKRALVAVTEAGWAAVFDLDASPYNSPDSDEPALRITPRGVPRVPMFEGLTCQRHGSLGLACGVEPPKPKEGDDEDEDTDEDEEKDEEVNKEDTEAAAVEDGEKGEEVGTATKGDETQPPEDETSRWFVRLLDLTGGVGCDLPTVLDPPEGHAFAHGPSGVVLHAFDGGDLAVLGAKKLPARPEPEPAAAEGAKAGADGDTAVGADGDAAAGEPASPEGETAEDTAPVHLPPPAHAATSLCLFRLPPVAERPAPSREISGVAASLERSFESRIEPENLAGRWALKPPNTVAVTLARLRASRGGSKERATRVKWRLDEMLGRLQKAAATSVVVDNRFTLNASK